MVDSVADGSHDSREWDGGPDFRFWGGSVRTLGLSMLVHLDAIDGNQPAAHGVHRAR